MTDVSPLERRLAALEHRVAITDRLYAVAHALDYGDEARFVDCFVPEAEIRVHERGQDEPTHVYLGHAGLHACFENHTQPPELCHKHLYLNPRMTVEGDHASCDCYCAVVAVAKHAAAPELLAFGLNRDRMIHCPDGEWRILARRSEMEAKSALPVWAVRSGERSVAGVLPERLGRVQVQPGAEGYA